MKKLLLIFVSLLWISGLGVFNAYAGDSARHFVYVQVKSGDSLHILFKREDVPYQTLMKLIKNPAIAKRLKHLYLGQKLRFELDNKKQLLSLALSQKPSGVFLIYRAGSRFVSRVEKGGLAMPKVRAVSSPPKPTKIAAKIQAVKIKTPVPVKAAPVLLKVNPKIILKTASKPIEKKKTLPITPTVPASFGALHFASFMIRSSLVSDGKKHHIPYPILQQLTKIFGTRINFRHLHPGDKVVLAYNDKLVRGKKVPGDIIGAIWTQGKKTFTAIQHLNDVGSTQYFSEKGEGSQKAFDRFPVKYTHINSLFNMHRMHPVTHQIRPHNGVDLAAPLGTPITSIGDGKITFIGWEGEYGNVVKIQYDEKYSSVSAHMLRFAHGLSVGSRVKRGQVVGFLGQTGNATGPHVHFEIRVYNIPKNPLTVPLPNSTAISSTKMQAFHLKSQQLINALQQYQKIHT